MSGLYTATLNRLQLVSKFDEHGNKISDTVSRIPITFCDLPYATAMAYMAKAPGECVITQQIREIAPTRAKFRERKDHYERHPASAPRHIASEDFSKEASIVDEAARSGDFGAAITAEMEEAS